MLPGHRLRPKFRCSATSAKQRSLVHLPVTDAPPVETRLTVRTLLGGVEGTLARLLGTACPAACDASGQTAVRFSPVRRKCLD